MKLLTRCLHWLMYRMSHYGHMYVDLHRQNWLYGGNSWYCDSAPKFSILWVETAGLAVRLSRQSRSAPCFKNDWMWPAEQHVFYASSRWPESLRERRYGSAACARGWKVSDKLNVEIELQTVYESKLRMICGM
jgi:hypothetical protein